MQHPMQHQNQDFRPSLTCFYCNKPGHKAIDCFYKFKDSRRMSASGQRGFVEAYPPMRIRSSVPQRPFVPPIRYSHLQQGEFTQQINQQRFMPRSPALPRSPTACGSQCNHEPMQQQQQQQQLSLPSEEGMEDNEYVEALCFMTNQRRELGRQGFENLQCQTEIGKRIKDLLINFENNL